MERSLDALLDQGSPESGLRDRGLRDRGLRDDGLPDSGWLHRGSLDHASLDRGSLPDGDPARWRAVAQVLAALTSAPESSELTGEARALAEFRAFADARARGADLPRQAPRRGPGWITWLPGGRPAVAAATGAVLMCGLLAVAYTGYLPAPAQRLAHETIDAPAASHDPDPAASSLPTGLSSSAGQEGHRAAHASARPDRRVHGGSASGHPHRPGSSSSPSGSSPGRQGSGRPGSGRPGSGRQGQSGSPGRSSEPGPTPEPSSSASISPSAGPTPSPSAAPSPTQSGHHPKRSPSSPQSTPP